MSQPTARPLPPLSSPALEQLRGRLEEGLARLARLTEMVSPSTPTSEEPLKDSDNPKADPWKALVSASSNERRDFPRRESHCRITVCRLSEDEDRLTLQQIEWRLHATRLKGELSDLSLNGAAIRLPQALPHGESIVMRLNCPRRDRHLDQYARVVRTLADDSGEYKVVCKFEKRLTLEQVSFFSRFLNQTGLI
jgi:hypothetical protein